MGQSGQASLREDSLWTPGGLEEWSVKKEGFWGQREDFVQRPKRKQATKTH